MRKLIPAVLIYIVFLSSFSAQTSNTPVIQQKFRFDTEIPGDRVVFASFSSDGKSVLLASEQSTQIWSAETGERILTFSEKVRLDDGPWFAWQPNGSKIIQYGNLGKKAAAIVWDADKGTRVAYLMEKRRVIRAEWNSLGDRILTVGDHEGYPINGNFTFSIRDENGKLLRRETIKRWLRTATFTKDGLGVVLGEEGREGKKAIQLTDRDSGDVVRTFDQDLKKSSIVNHAIFSGESPDGKYMCGEIYLSKGVICWSKNDDRKPFYFLDNQQAGDITFLGFSSDSRSFAILKAKARVIEIIDSESGKLRASLDNWNKAYVTKCSVNLNWGWLYRPPRQCESWSPSGKYFVASNFKKEANIWDTRSGKLIAQIPVIYDEDREFLESTYVSDYEEFSFNPKNEILLSVSGGSVRLLRPENGEVIFQFGSRNKKERTEGYQRNIARWSPDGKFMMTSAALTKSVILWEIRD